MKSKLISIPYTVGIIKPHLAIKDEKVFLSFFNYLTFKYYNISINQFFC